MHPDEAKIPDSAAKRRRGGSRIGPGRPTKRQIEERNDELLDKTLDLFVEKGFEATTIVEITQAVGMAKRTVTGRYGNKVSLFKAALKRAIDLFAVPEKRLRDAECEDFEQSLHTIATIILRNYLEPANLKLARVTNASAHTMPEISRYMYDQFTQPLTTYLADLFRRRLLEDAEYQDADRHALTFLTLLGAPARLLAWGVPLKPAEIDDHAAYSVRVFLHGVIGSR